VATEYGLGVIPYFSLASGFLTGKYRGLADTEGKARGAMVAKYLNPQGIALVEELRSIAGQHKTTPAAVALAWLLTRPAIAAPIASATSTDHVAELAKAGKVALSPSDLDRLSTPVAV